jgi:hypothetical protein
MLTILPIYTIHRITTATSIRTGLAHAICTSITHTQRTSTLATFTTPLTTTVTWIRTTLTRATRPQATLTRLTHTS